MNSAALIKGKVGGVAFCELDPPLGSCSGCVLREFFNSSEPWFDIMITDVTPLPNPEAWNGALPHLHVEVLIPSTSACDSLGDRVVTELPRLALRSHPTQLVFL